MALVPHERSLVQKLQDKPFALIGVNGDNDRETAKKVVQEKQINWRSFWNGRDGKITTDWKLEAWPTLVLIDNTGVIRQKWLGSPGDEVLNKAIDDLVKKAEEGEKVSFLSQ